MEYLKTLLKEEIVIRKIVTVHYFEFAKDYIFKGEKHDFWEFLYVDKGEVEVMAETKGFQLKQGEMIFHKPNEFHNVWANGRVAPNLIIVSFDCKSESVKFFESKIISIGEMEKNLLGNILSESREAFSSYKTENGKTSLNRNTNALFGCEQLMKLYMEMLLISLVRKGTNVKRESRLSFSIKQRFDNDMVKKIVDYMNSNLTNNLSFEDICRYSGLGSTNLKSLFKEKVETGVMEYYKTLKIDRAKEYIREDMMNFTEIAERLGYTSIHYFSRHFKKVTSMTPSEYVASVQSKIK
jgi:AraC-like DNA-binding protein/quercetin dioxygenase-like cupin family protein